MEAGDKSNYADEKFIHPLFLRQAQAFVYNTKDPKDWMPLHQEYIPTSILYDNTRGIYRVISVDSLCKKVIINSTVTPNFEFFTTSQRFGHWTDYYSTTIYGIGFKLEEEMIEFTKCLNMTKSAIMSGTPVNLLSSSMAQLNKNTRPSLIKSKKNCETTSISSSATDTDADHKETRQLEKLNKNLLSLLQQASAKTDAMDVILPPPQQRNTATATIRKDNNNNDNNVKIDSKHDHHGGHSHRNHNNKPNKHRTSNRQNPPPPPPPSNFVVEEPEEWRRLSASFLKDNPPPPSKRSNEIDYGHFGQDIRLVAPVAKPDEDENMIIAEINRLQNQISCMQTSLMDCFRKHKTWQGEMRNLLAQKCELVKGMKGLSLYIENKKQAAYAFHQDRWKETRTNAVTVLGTKLVEDKYQALLADNARLEEFIKNLNLSSSIQSSLDLTACSKQAVEMENYYKQLLRSRKKMLTEALGTNQEGIQTVGRVDDLFCKTIHELKTIHGRFRDAYTTNNDVKNY